MVDTNTRESNILNELSLHDTRWKWANNNLLLDKVVALKERDVEFLREISDLFEASTEVISESALEKRGGIEEKKKNAEQGLTQAYFSLGEQALRYSLLLGTNAMIALKGSVNDEGDQNKKNFYKGALLFVNIAMPYLYKSMEHELEVGPLENPGQKPYSHAVQAANILVTEKPIEFFVIAMFRERTRRLFLRDLKGLPSLTYTSDGSQIGIGDACRMIAHGFPDQYFNVRSHAERVLGEPPLNPEQKQHFTDHFEKL